ncbi:MAG: hypothetical protein LH481_09160 [Burkholderiales bacterium]|nr:hypothetical protein [Burkholderiales bacterium]
MSPDQLPEPHMRLWQRAPQWAAVHIVTVIVGGLALDAVFGWPGQYAAIFWTFCVWGWLFRNGAREERRVLVLCTLIAGFGEVILSLVWGLYDYQFSNVPLFVPPGHALLMTLGLVTSQKLLKHKAGRAFQGIFPWIALIYAGFAWTIGFDQFGAALFGVFGVCMIFSRARMLYATMFVLALAMELYGTTLGNWTWVTTTPGLGITAANPPFSAGAFYCLLDLLVLGAIKLMAPERAIAKAAASSAQN